MAISKVSFFKTPQAGDDNYYWTEDSLQLDTNVYINSTHLMLDVMANDLGGAAKKLYSIDDGNGNPIDPTDLLNADTLAGGISTWEPTACGNQARINNGKIEFDLSHELPGGVNSLGSGDQFTDTFIYAIRLANGTLSWAHVHIQIDGVNDDATITPSDDEDTTVVEAGGIANGTAGDPDASGQLTVTDPDAGENKFQAPGSLDGTYGKFTFDADTGAWTYTLDQGKADKLVGSEAATDTLTVTSLDGTDSYDIKVDITGSNDNASIAADGPQDAAVIEAGGAGNAAPGDPDASGKLVVSDVDAGENKFQAPGSLDGTYGKFTFDADTGAWTYTLDQGKADKLTDGEGAADTLTVTSYDGTDSYDIKIDIIGSNDDASIAIVGSEDTSVTEDGGIANATLGDPSASGKLAVSDVDAGENTFEAPGSLDGKYGTFTFDTGSGEWTYTLDQGKADELAGGAAATDTLTVSSFDGTATHDIVVDITGANDAPTARDDSYETDEDVSLTADGAGGNPAGLLDHLDGAETADDTDVDGDDLDIAAVKVGATEIVDGGAGDEDGVADGTINFKTSHGLVSLDVETGTFTYASDADYNGSDGFDYKTTDGALVSGWATAAITINAVNDAPVLDALKTPAGASVAEDSGAPVGAVGTLVSQLVDLNPPLGGLDNLIDVDAGAVTGIAITAADGAHGTWYYSINNGGTWTALGAVSDISSLLLTPSARLYFQPAADYDGDAAITFRAWDQTSGTNSGTADTTANGGTTAFSTATDTATFDVTPVNDAPVLDAIKTPAGTAVAEDSGLPVGAVGTLISQLVDLSPPAGGLDNVTDVDASPVTGIAITAADGTHGTWYYSTNNGGAWAALGAVSDISSLLLTPSARLYFQPAANYDGDAAITFRAWDQTSGTNGGTADTTSNGGTTAFSSATDSAIFDVTPVNDAPVINVDGVAMFTTGGPAVLVDNSITITDVDNTTLTSATIAIGAGTFRSGDSLNFTDQLGITGLYNALTGILTLTGPVSLANFDAAIETITFSTTSTDATTRTISYTVNDGSANSAADTATVSVVLGVDPNDFNNDNQAVNAKADSGDGNANTLHGTVNADNIDGNGGNDTIYGGAGNDTLNGNNEDDTIFGGSGDDKISGGNGNDSLYGGSGKDTITGGNDDDTIYGGSDADNIDGSGGNDIIIGGYASDTLTGSGGSDTFKYLSLLDGRDSISDFDITVPASGGDKLDISDVLDIAGNTWTDGGTLAAAVAGGYVTFTEETGTHTVQVNVDIDGTAGGSAPAALAVLTNVAWVSAVQAQTDLADNIALG
jgi:VCBS repeat-containing protein